MNYESLTYERIIPYEHGSAWHHVVRVYSACEVPGMMDISVWTLSPDNEKTKTYQFYMIANKVRRIPDFKRFVSWEIRESIRTGIKVNAVMPYNFRCFSW